MIFLLFLPLILIAIYLHARRPTRDCRWRADRTRDTDDGALFHCIHCGAELRTIDGKPPQVCAGPGGPDAEM